MKVITIGRSSNNDEKINDPYVGRHHCQIIYDNGQFRIVNIDAKNGTYVNGNKINGEMILSSADIVKIGNTVIPWKTYFVEIGESPLPPPPPPPPPSYGIWVFLSGLASLGFIAYIVIDYLTSFGGKMAGIFGGAEGILKLFPIYLHGYIGIEGQWFPMIAALVLAIVASFINGVLIEEEQEDGMSKAGKGIASFTLVVSIIFLLLAIFAKQIVEQY